MSARRAGDCGLSRRSDSARLVVAGSIGGSNSAVECQLPKLDVAGSIPVSRSMFLRILASISLKVESMDFTERQSHLPMLSLFCLGVCVTSSYT
jgi:hypothetical protein